MRNESSQNRMKIFVGFGYNARDKWICELVFPILEAFGDEPVTGEDLQGQPIVAGVRKKIADADAMIGFVTRRDRIDDGRWTTHRWVTDEISHALASKVPFVVEVRETGVDDQGGIVFDCQRIPYDETQRDACLVNIAKVIGGWHRELAQQRPIRLKLLPDSCYADIAPIYGQPGFSSGYRLMMVDGSETDLIKAEVRPIRGGLFMEVKNVRRDSLIRVQLDYRT